MSRQNALNPLTREDDDDDDDGGFRLREVALNSAANDLVRRRLGGFRSGIKGSNIP